ncbi:MAG: hypothetical protein ABJ317_08495, partial [Marinomonas sp.]
RAAICGRVLNSKRHCRAIWHFHEKHLSNAYVQDIQNPAGFLRNGPIQKAIDDFGDFTTMPQTDTKDSPHQCAIVEGQFPKPGVAGIEIKLIVQRAPLVDHIAEEIRCNLASGKPWRLGLTGEI